MADRSTEPAPERVTEPLRVAFQTFGCRLNQSDTEGLAAAFGADGYRIVPFREQADLYVINSCSITAHAEADARRAVRRARERGGTDARIVVTGCYAQRAPDEVAGLGGVDRVIGNDRKTELPELVGEAAPDGRVTVGDIGSVTTIAEYPLPLASERTRAYLRVQDGCEDHCTFCVVPATRGGFRSLPIERAVDRLRALVEIGYREIVLTGANLSSYGAERPGGPQLHDLLGALLAVEGDYRLRLSSFEPSDLTPELIGLFLDQQRLCRHLHIPVQSLDDGVLRLMRRSYDAALAADAVRRLAAAVPAISLGTDLMVGFPGETEAAFRTTLQRVESLPFTYFHVFPYSPRPDTTADSMRDDVPKVEKQRRSRLLRDVGAAKARGFASGQLGERARVLVERCDATGQHLRGYTDNYIRVSIPVDGGATNRFVEVVLAPEHLEVLHSPPLPDPIG